MSAIGYPADGCTGNIRINGLTPVPFRAARDKAEDTEA